MEKTLSRVALCSACRLRDLTSGLPVVSFFAGNGHWNAVTSVIGEKTGRRRRMQNRLRSSILDYIRRVEIDAECWNSSCKTPRCRPSHGFRFLNQEGGGVGVLARQVSFSGPIRDGGRIREYFHRFVVVTLLSTGWGNIYIRVASRLRGGV